MQTAREYAISKGLAVPGRGKLSFDAHAAIQGFIDGGGKLSDWDKNGKIASPSRLPKAKEPKPVAKPKPKQSIAAIKASIPEPKPYVAPTRKVFNPDAIKPIRVENVIRIIDKQGVAINVGSCQAGHSVRRCTCSKVLPSKWLQDNAQSIELVVG